MARTISLRGIAAAVLFQGYSGRPPASEGEKYARIATYVFLAMAQKNAEGMRKASLIIESVTKEGIDKTLAIMEGRNVDEVQQEAAPAQVAVHQGPV